LPTSATVRRLRGLTQTQPVTRCGFKLQPRRALGQPIRVGQMQRGYAGRAFSGLLKANFCSEQHCSLQHRLSRRVLQAALPLRPTLPNLKQLTQALAANEQPSLLPAGEEAHEALWHWQVPLAVLMGHFCASRQLPQQSSHILRAQRGKRWQLANKRVQASELLTIIVTTQCLLQCQ